MYCVLVYTSSQRWCLDIMIYYYQRLHDSEKEVTSIKWLLSPNPSISNIIYHLLQNPVVKQWGEEFFCGCMSNSGLPSSLLFRWPEQHDWRARPVDRWGIRPGWLHPDPRIPRVAWLWLRGLAEWECYQWLHRDHVWIWPNQEFYYYEGQWS